MSQYAITGVQDGLTTDKDNILRQVPVRMELDTWCNSTDTIHKNQRSLFFLAFNEFCNKNPTEKLSYFQIAGIHGQPFVPWDEDDKAPVANSKSGYCTHNSILFTTWHRPYMLLFEQVLYGLMKEAAAKFSEEEQPALLEALQSWRFPYWDWASKKHDPLNPTQPDNYNLPLVLPYRAVEIKVPESYEPKTQESSFGPAITNPFYQFAMPEGYTSMGDPKLGKLAIVGSNSTRAGVEYRYPLDVCKATTRHADFGPDHDPEEIWIAGKQNNKEVVNALRSLEYETEDHNTVAGSLRATPSDAFYRVSLIESFEDFGTKRVKGMGPGDGDPKENVYDSAENLHDWIHGVCGGAPKLKQLSNNKILYLKGHMSEVPVAAFDPIFWVHHCNVDRLVAIWEVLRKGKPDNWFDGSDVRDRDTGNWAIRRNNPDRPTDPLRPFHKDETGTTYWNSNDIRDTAPLGYTYPELEKWKYIDAEGNYDHDAHKAALSVYLNTSYNAAARAAFLATATRNPGEEAQDPESAKPTLQGLQLFSSPPTPKADIIGYDDYVVNIIYNRFALSGRPYTIHIFVGKVPDRVPYTFDDPEGSLVGQVFTFSTPADRLGTDADVGCVNCRQQQAGEVMSSGTVVLTNALITRWKNQLTHTPRHRFNPDDVPTVLPSMKPEDVIPFLKTNLRWRVTSLGEVVPTEELKSLRVSVAVGKADHFADPTKLSRFYDYKAAYEVTQDRNQGAGPDDGLYPPGQEYTTQG
ncbi:common central domain of tyrosinase-domain-containing protein [Podospora fimiseda]|uniref:tyrosinase n=1 Tax=Podospora fimiseda TaxID=252190 RepID=A0AAN7GZJ2_9PEZI|nr:common central domain of tyrosinase-domain-containing protein [Podospora fimiseda]